MKKKRETSEDSPRKEMSGLSKLKEYKELITVIIFFVGGIVWIYGYFATKSSLTTISAQLQCLLNTHVTLISSEMEHSKLQADKEKIAIELNSKISELEKLKSEAASDKLVGLKEEIVKLEEKYKDFELKYELISKKIGEASDQIKLNNCYRLSDTN